MPSLGDSVFIFMLALIVLGPKKLPQLARQLGKLMAEFRKASNDFRMQMEDELRIEDQKEHQKKVDALAPPPSAVPNPDIPTEDPPHPHMPAVTENSIQPESPAAPENPVPAENPVQPIAQSGDLRMMPPSTGLPLESTVRRSAFASSNTGRDGRDSTIGMSSEEPAQATEEPAQATEGETALHAMPYEPPPDRGHPVMAGEGERATHV